MSSNPDGQPGGTTQPTQNATTRAFPPTAMPRELAPNTPADVNRMQGVLNSPRIPPSFRASNISNPNVSYAGDASGGNPNPGNRNFNNPQPFRGWNPILAAPGDPLLVYFHLPLNGLLGVSYQQSGQGVVFIARDATLYQFKREILDMVYSDFFNFGSGIGPVVFEIRRVFVRWVSIDGQSTTNELVYDEELGRALAAMARRGFRDELHVYFVLIHPMSDAVQQSSSSTGGEASGNAKGKGKEAEH